jgi:hypothetical protein
MTIDPARLEAFALAYAPAILAAVKTTRPLHGSQSAEDYALEVTLAMLASLKRVGIEGIEHYYLNAQAGALKQTAAELGVEVSHLQLYLEGKT